MENRRIRTILLNLYKKNKTCIFNKLNIYINYLLIIVSIRNTNNLYKKFVIYNMV